MSGYFAKKILSQSSQGCTLIEALDEKGSTCFFLIKTKPFGNQQLQTNQTIIPEEIGLILFKGFGVVNNSVLQFLMNQYGVRLS